MDIAVERNAFGRQLDSFEADLQVEVLKEGRTKPFPAVFIRAPRLVEARPPAQVIARLTDGTAVAARAGRLLVTSFHPELSRDLRFHEYFLEMVRLKNEEDSRSSGFSRSVIGRQSQLLLLKRWVGDEWRSEIQPFRR
jgi:5'-phosphate synthase pdxT subunit